MVGSTIMNTSLIKSGVERNLAFMSTLGVFSIFNYLLLSRLVGEQQDEKSSAPTTGLKLPPSAGPSHDSALHAFVAESSDPVVIDQ